VEIEIFEQLLFDAGADAVAEEGTVGDDDRGSATGDITLTFTLPEGEGEPGRLSLRIMS
jgi:hypothetical protein